MFRYYFRTTNTDGKLTNEFITISALDLPEARSLASSYCKEHGIKYRMTPIMEEEITEDIPEENTRNSEEKDLEPVCMAETIGMVLGHLIYGIFPWLCILALHYFTDIL